MITSFPDPSGANIGGMWFFNFIESNLVSSIPPLINDAITIAPTLAGSASWKRGYNTQLTLGYKEKATNDVNRPKWTQELSGFCPEFNAGLQRLFKEMMQYRFVLDCLDNQEKRVIVGSPTNGMHFEYTFDSKPDAKGRKGYAYRFFRDSDDPAIFFVAPVPITDPGPGGSG